MDNVTPLNQTTSGDGINFNITLPPEAAIALVKHCNQLKQNMVSHAQEKKNMMRDGYAYMKGKFVGNDLLPVMSHALGSDHDVASGRPQLFVPLTRAQVKLLYSQLKLTLFPNDQDYFRVRAKTKAGIPYEEELTAGLQCLFREAMISEKIASSLLNLIWAGSGAAHPTMSTRKTWQWQFNQEDKAYEAFETTEATLPDIETYNPIHFYMNPMAQKPEHARWVYCTQKSLQALKDEPQLYMNLEAIPHNVSQNASYTNAHGRKQNRHDVSFANALNATFQDTEPHVDYDLYYFPHVECHGETYRNMLVGIANETTLIRFQPNLYPKGLNPVVFSTWMPDVDSPYGTGPVEDMKEIQRLINIVWNYAIESAARNGNRWAIREDVDVSSLFGAAGGIVITEGDPRSSIVPLSGDMAEFSQLLNAVGSLKAEAEVLAGSQHPFQGAANIDFKKTATEMQLLQENAMSTLREVIEHITVSFVQPILERLMHLVGETYTEPMALRFEKPLETKTEDMQASDNTSYRYVDFSLLKRYPYTIDVTSVNLAQSRMAMIRNLTQLLELAQNNPAVFQQFRDNGYHVVKLLAECLGVRQIDKMLSSPTEQRNEIQQKNGQLQHQKGEPNQMNAPSDAPRPSLEDIVKRMPPLALPPEIPPLEMLQSLREELS